MDVLIAPELSRLGNEAEHLVGKVSQRSVSHHDLSDAKLKRYEENVGKLREVLKVNDPFIIEDDELINIVTRAIMPEVVKQAVIQRDSVGEEMFEKFVQERLVNLELNVWSPMKKANLKTWKTARMVKKSKKAVAVTAIKNERALFARFLVVILSRPDLDLKKSISEFEFAEYPHSLFTFDGILRSCVAKSKLMTILERLPDQQQLVVAQEEQTQHGRVTIIDAMAVVQSMGKPTWVKTGYDLANHFLHVLDCKSQGFHEVHIVFDRYDIPNSLKERTRNLRLGDHRSLAYNISDEPIIEKVTLKQLLNNQDNKQRLTLYLALHILKHRKESEKIHVTTLSEECKSNKLILHHLNSTQEEADTRMLLHALDASQRGATSICIQSPDTDVLVLALWCYKDLCPATSMLVGTGGLRRTIDLGPIYDALGSQKASALPGFHALSGCDQTGTFCGKSKISCRNTLQKADGDMVRAFGNLGNTPCIQEYDVSELERYVCQLYVPGTTISSVNEMRWFLFSKRQYTNEKLPHIKATLVQKINRANYVTMVWKQCGTASSTLPPPTSHGWRLEGNRLLPVPTTVLPAPHAVLQLVKCGCHGSCSTMICSCRKHNLKCTDTCICEEACENRIVNIHTAGDDSDDDDDVLET